MTKRKPQRPVELRLELTDQLLTYIDYLVQGGLHGSTREEVLQRMVCDGLRAVIPQALVTQVANAVKNGALGKSEV